MQQHVVKGLALVRRQAAGSKILLVRTAANAPWSLPTAEAGESVDQLLQALRADLFPRTNLTQVADISRTFPLREGATSFELVGTDADLLPYFESERFVDARWASFEEARHIVRRDLEEVLRWSKRLLHKLPLTALIAS